VDVMMKRTLWRLSLLFAAALASGTASSPAFAQANADWWRRQQQQQQQQQRQQQEMERQRRQQQEAERQRLREQERQRLQQQERQRMQQQQRQQQQQQQQQQQLGRRQSQAANSNTRGGATSVVARSGDRVLYANGVARLNRPPTTAELRRGFTGKVTQDGRALVRVNNRVLAVPAARVGVKFRVIQGSGGLQASRWNDSKRAAVTTEVRTIATASLKNTVITGGPGGLKEKFNAAAGTPPGGGGKAGGGSGGGGAGGGGNGRGGGGDNGGGASNDNKRPRRKGDLTGTFNGAARRPPPPKKGDLPPIFNDAARKSLKKKLDEPVPVLKPSPKPKKPANDNNKLPPWNAPKPNGPKGPGR
jgi:hypothetical protein